jgi:hypothetical protein
MRLDEIVLEGIMKWTAIIIRGANNNYEVDSTHIKTYT